jgi:hypothetical protein
MNKAKSSGILSIISGLFGLIYASSLVVVSKLGGIFSVIEPRHIPPELYPVILVFVFVFVVFSLLAVIGGMLIFRKKRYGLALVGAICSMLMFFPCGIPALIILIKAKSEFSGEVSIT